VSKTQCLVSDLAVHKGATRLKGVKQHTLKLMVQSVTYAHIKLHRFYAKYQQKPIISKN